MGDVTSVDDTPADIVFGGIYREKRSRSKEGFALITCLGVVRRPDGRKCGAFVWPGKPDRSLETGDPALKNMQLVGRLGFEITDDAAKVLAAP